jgi:choline dehydrogenase-like flavoprotein
MSSDSAARVPSGTELRTDVLVIGSGAAGITVARELDGAKLDVIVLEAGGWKRDVDTERDLFAIDELAMPRLNPEASRVRCFGGSTELWFGRIAVLDQIDFERRDWVPHSGWPIERAELSPWLDRAADVLAVPNFDMIDPEAWRGNPTADAFDAVPGAEIGVFLWSTAMQMGAHHRGLLERSQNVRLLVDATATELVPNKSSTMIERVRVARPDGESITIVARTVVLAAGGLENPRLMLASTSQSEHGVGNAHGLVGRCLMDHLRGEGLARADLSRADATVLRRLEYLGERTSTEVGAVQLRVKFTADQQRRHELLNSSIHAHLVSSEQSNPGFQSAKRLVQRLRGAGSTDGGAIGPDVWSVVRNSPVLATLAAKKLTGRVRPNSIVFIDQMEQAPELDSRVRLDHRRPDRFGLPRLQTEWRIGSSTYRTLRHMHELMEAVLTSIGVNDFRSKVLDAPDVEPELWDMKHPSGTTRMASSPDRGVVDPSGRVHGIDNLYVTGSSVFPTVGHANPTLTIVALAARLASHLKTNGG